MMEFAFNPSIRETETGGSLRDQGQPGLRHSEFQCHVYSRFRHGKWLLQLGGSHAVSREYRGVRTWENSCKNCEAGTFCKESSRLCFPCPSSTFSSTGGQKHCIHCTKCEGNFRVKKRCSPISNAECECIPGYHCLEPNCSRCEEDCRKGEELTKDGCKVCPFGTFNNLEAGGSCRPWTNCSLDGKSVHRIGTKDRDVVCGPASTLSSSGHSTQVLTLLLALTSATSLFLLSFVILRRLMVKWSRKKFLSIFKQPFKTPMAQEEDACSCRFPEEEEGSRL